MGAVEGDRLDGNGGAAFVGGLVELHFVAAKTRGDGDLIAGQKARAVGIAGLSKEQTAFGFSFDQCHAG